MACLYNKSPWSCREQGRVLSGPSGAITRRPAKADNSVHRTAQGGGHPPQSASRSTRRQTCFLLLMADTEVCPRAVRRHHLALRPHVIVRILWDEGVGTDTKPLPCVGDEKSQHSFVTEHRNSHLPAQLKINNILARHTAV